MPREIWEARVVRDHLLAVYTGQITSLEFSLPDPSRAKAYKRGIEVVLRYLAQRFGITTLKKTQTSELRTWNRDDIRRILIEVRTLLQEADKQGTSTISYNRDYIAGIDHTLNAVALSFDIQSGMSG